MKRVHVLFNRDLLQVRKGLRRKEMSSQAIARTVGMRVLGEREDFTGGNSLMANVDCERLSICNKRNTMYLTYWICRQAQ
jgi:hypothetical protein